MLLEQSPTTFNTLRFGLLIWLLNISKQFFNSFKIDELIKKDHFCDLGIYISTISSENVLS